MPIASSKLKAAEAKKLEADRLQGFLQEMLKEEENKYCADCEQKQPRWAAWNLGVFLCIRCAGLHRNLGVHISKVKSVTLDSWTAEQVQSMRVMGNAKARAVYENELPHLFRRPQTDQSLEQFIRSKYDVKKYIMKGWAPPRVDVNDLPALPEGMARERKEKQRPGSTEPTTIGKPHKSSPPLTVKAPIQQLIDFDFSAPAPTDATNDAQKDLASVDDLFGPIVSAAPLPQQHTIPTSMSTPNLSSNASTANNLFFGMANEQPQTRVPNVELATPSASTAFPAHPQPTGINFMAAPAQNNPQPQQQSMHSSLIGSDLLGLDFTACSLGPQGQEVQAAGIRPSQQSVSLNPPPATDIKKSTNEILALFQK